MERLRELVWSLSVVDQYPGLQQMFPFLKPRFEHLIEERRALLGLNSHTHYSSKGVQLLPGPESEREKPHA